MDSGVGDTILDVLTRLFPRRAKKNALEVAPSGPPDVFAAAALLLELSGAYHHVQPDGDPTATKSPRIISLLEDDRKDAQRLADEWKAMPVKPARVPPGVQERWEKLAKKYGNQPVYKPLGAATPCPPWWRIALELLLVADAAVADEVGWIPMSKLKSVWSLAVKRLVTDELNDARGYLNTIAFETNQDIANVLPKSRTPGVGCTVRSLSQHLALLPPRGVARAYWVSPVNVDPAPADALNILIVPFPYKIAATSFVAMTDKNRVRERKWGWFGLKPSWLDRLAPDDVSDWVKALMHAGELDCGSVHAVVLPELALNWLTYEKLARALQGFPHVEFLVSGLTTDQDGRTGNFVATTLFEGGIVRETMTRVREKHHRWKLDRSQIGTYALSSTLKPNVSWWEKLDIMSRSLDVFVFREKSSLTTLICEDLARVDPCQELVRAIGPNLVIALLMDSAQVKDRWPARYATVLAEDPGSSVLTVNSRALLDRANAEGRYDRSDAVALWRDDTGTLRSISLPPDMDAVVMTLAGDFKKERTLDGRSVENAVSWHFHGQQPVRADAADSLRKRMGRNI